jgi:uncharacterized damage-inducible protein DinB
MTGADVLIDCYGRIRELVHDALDGVSQDHLTVRLDPQANTIAWLIWHLTRIQDDHVAGVTGEQQVWTAAGWNKRFALPLDDSEDGYGHSAEQVARVTGTPELLRGYFDAVADATDEFLHGLSETELDRVVDERWDPPVTLGARLVSVLSDDIQHAGQAAYIRGILERRS